MSPLLKALFHYIRRPAREAGRCYNCFMSKLSNLKASQRFTATLVLLLILPIVIVSIIVGHTISSFDFNNACKARLALMEQTVANLNTFTNDTKYVSLNILSDSKVQYLFKTYRDPNSDPVARESLLVGFSVNSVLESRDYIKAISLFDNEGLLYQYGLRVEDEDREFEQEIYALKGRPHWTAAYKQMHQSPYYANNLRGDYVVSLMRVVNDLYQFEHALGIVRITFDEVYICSLYDGLKSSDGLMYIYNKDGDIVSSTDKSLLGSNISTNRRLFSNTGNGSFTEGNSVVFHVRQVDPDWTLVLEEPNNMVSSGETDISMLTLLNVAVIIVFGLVFLIMQHRGIIRPVMQLSKDLQDYKEGNFTIAIYSTSKDEIGQLNRALKTMSDYISNLIEREYKSKLAEQKIELENLQMQINPHFLYNTIDTIRWMAIMKDEKEIAAHLESLSSLFRHNLNQGERYTTVKAELQHLKDYLSLMQARFADTLKFEINADPKLADAKMLKLLIQPLVENAIVHGLEPKAGAGYVTICVDRWDGKLRFIVKDNGAGIDAKLIQDYVDGVLDAKRSFALKNIQDRIRLEYGEEYGISIYGDIGVGTEMQIVLPILYEVDNDK